MDEFDFFGKLLGVGFIGAVAAFGGWQVTQNEQEIKRMTQIIDDVNRDERKIVVDECLLQNNGFYLPANEIFMLSNSGGMQALALTGNASAYNVVISGGKDNYIRNKSLITIIEDVHSHNIPIIILHCSNTDLEQKLVTLPAYRSNKVKFINGISHNYGVFSGMNSLEISDLIFSSMPDKYKNSLSSRNFIRIMSEMIILQNLTPTLHHMVNWKDYDLGPIITKQMRDNKTLATNYATLNEAYKRCQLDGEYLRYYFTGLKNQIKTVYDTANTNVNITKAIDNNEIVSLNVGDNSNDLLINLVTHHLQHVIHKGHNFMLIVDNINLHTYKELLQLILLNRQCKFVLCHDDLCANIHSDKAMFSNIMGNVQKYIIYSHFNQDTCDTWSKELGEYTKIDYTITIGSQRNHIYAGKNKSLIISRKHGERRVPSSVLKKLCDHQVCVYDIANKAIFFTDTSGYNKNVVNNNLQKTRKQKGLWNKMTHLFGMKNMGSAPIKIRLYTRKQQTILRRLTHLG